MVLTVGLVRLAMTRSLSRHNSRTTTTTRMMHIVGQIRKLEEELRDAKEDIIEGNEYSDAFAYKLSVADGKVMLMTKTLHTSFATLLQMTEALQTGASIAKKFIGLHDVWPAKGRKNLDPYRRECEKLCLFNCV